MSEVEMLVAKLQAGELSPDQAVKAFESPAVRIADIGFSDEVYPLYCGFNSIETLQLLRAGQDDLVVIAGRPGSGKTALLYQIALNVSKSYNVLGFSLEMSKMQINSRLVAAESKVPLRQLRMPQHAKDVKDAITRFGNYRLSVIDTNGLDIDSLVRQTLDEHRRAPIDMVVVDYLQIVPTKTGRSKSEEVAYVSQALKRLAQKIGAPVVTAAQMNREFDGRLASDKAARPIMSDLADSAGIERWADMLMCLNKAEANAITAYVLKNRHGEARDFQLEFNGEQMRFTDQGLSI